MLKLTARLEWSTHARRRPIRWRLVVVVAAALGLGLGLYAGIDPETIVHVLLEVMRSC
jgi:hypothetical protein